MAWLVNLLWEELATFIYMFVLFPVFVVLQISFMIMAAILWPISKLLINRIDKEK